MKNLLLSFASKIATTHAVSGCFDVGRDLFSDGSSRAPHAAVSQVQSRTGHELHGDRQPGYAGLFEHRGNTMCRQIWAVTAAALQTTRLELHSSSSVFHKQCTSYTIGFNSVTVFNGSVHSTGHRQCSYRGPVSLPACLDCLR